jgi:hypothetical protein
MALQYPIKINKLKVKFFFQVLMYFVVTEEFRGIRDRDQTEHRILHKVVRH